MVVIIQDESIRLSHRATLDLPSPNGATYDPYGNLTSSVNVGDPTTTAAQYAFGKVKVVTRTQKKARAMQR